MDPVEPIEPTVPVEPVEPTEPTEPIEPQEPVEPVEPTEDGFNETQLQQMYSASGRIISKQFEEKIVPMLQEFTPKAPAAPAPNATEDLNKQLQDQIFAGDVIGAFDRYSDLKKTAETNRSNQQDVETNKAITTYSKDPLYKELYDDATKIAGDLVKNGFPPGPAARTAFAEAKASHFERKQSGDSAGSLSMTTSGVRTTTTKTVKLPPAFKKACAKGIVDGLWQDEKEYVAELSPTVKAKLGI